MLCTSAADRVIIIDDIDRGHSNDSTGTAMTAGNIMITHKTLSRPNNAHPMTFDRREPMDSLEFKRQKLNKERPVHIPLANFTECFLGLPP